MKKTTFIILFGILLVNSFPLEKEAPDAAPSQVVAVCLWAENTTVTAEFYCELLGLPEPFFALGGRN